MIETLRTSVPADAHGATMVDEQLSSQFAVETVQLGTRVCDIVASPSADHIYVAVADCVMVINRFHNIVTKIPVGRAPKRMILSADGVFLYVIDYDGSLFIINNTDHTSTTIANSPTVAEVVSPDGGRIYLAHHAMSNERDHSWISIVDADGTTLARVPIDTCVTGMDLSPDGSRLYVATSRRSPYTQYYPGLVSVIDTGTHTAVDNIAVSVSPTTLTVSPDGSRTFITHYDTNAITAIDLIRRSVTSICVQDAPLAVAITPDSSKMYVIGLRSLAVIDITTELTHSIPVGELPRCLHFGEDGKQAYVTDFGRHAVAVLDTITDTVMATVEVGGNPEAIALSNDGQRLYVADYWAGALTAISIESVMRDWDNTRHVED